VKSVSQYLTSYPGCNLQLCAAPFQTSHRV